MNGAVKGGGVKDKDGDNAANVIVAEMLMEDHHTIPVWGAVRPFWSKWGGSGGSEGGGLCKS